MQLLQILLFGYRPQASQLWETEVAWINAEILLVGHTHTPFVRRIGGCTIVNPGSLGQPKTGRTLACYTTWEDGEISLKEYEYPVQKTIRQIRRMPLSGQDIEELAAVETADCQFPGAKPGLRSRIAAAHPAICEQSLKHSREYQGLHFLVVCRLVACEERTADSL